MSKSFRRAKAVRPAEVHDTQSGIRGEQRGHEFERRLVRRRKKHHLRAAARDGFHRKRFAGRFAPSAQLWVQLCKAANRGVAFALNEAGIETVFTGEPRASEVEAVFVGWHPECHMKDIEAACQAIWAGAKLYVASDVPFFATRQGRAMGYSYAIVGAIRRMTKAPMILTGKPSLHAMRFVARKLGVPVRDVGVVGDDPAVEIIMARRGGATAFGVTTGVMKQADWERETGKRRPHFVLNDLRELLTRVP